MLPIRRRIIYRSARRSTLEDGLRFVTHVRKQQAAIRSWLQEAFERDTGTGD